jgi:hypothetical protein
MWIYGQDTNPYPGGRASQHPDADFRFQTFVAGSLCPPQATLDVRGYARLAVNTAAPAACAPANRGSIALTSTFRICACNGAAWVHTHDVTSCVW